MKIEIMSEPSPHAKLKDLKKGQIYTVDFSGPGRNQVFPGEWFYSIQPPIGKSQYAFYDSEVRIIH